MVQVWSACLPCIVPLEYFFSVCLFVCSPHKTQPATWHFYKGVLYIRFQMKESCKFSLFFQCLNGIGHT